jgi:hypothetical protein
MRRHKRILGIAILYLLSPYVSAATITVDDDGPADHASIQAAINAAGTGDEIVVAPGRYRETLNFLNKSITVRSRSGPADTVIFLEQETRIVLLNGDSTLRGFTVTGGRSRVGGGILVTDGADPVIEECIIEGNLAARGGSSFPSFGGGIAVDPLSRPVITRNIIRDNTAEGDVDGLLAYGGAIDVGDDSSATITNNVIAGNTATDSGGGISIGVAGADGAVEIIHNTLAGNHAGAGQSPPVSYGGGILVNDGAEVTIRSNLLADNSAEADGGGIHFFTGGLQGITYELNDFSGNTPNDCGGLQANKCDGGQLFLTPLFFDAAAGNYRQRSDSPILDRGSGSGVPPVDIDGYVRMVDSDMDGTAVPDIGAYENQSEITRLRFDDRTTLAWDSSINPSVTFDLYRDDLATTGPGAGGECLQGGLGAATYTDGTEPAAGSGFFYLVGGSDIVLGSLGFGTDGTERFASVTCP